jgi:hypothetical protein
MASPRCTAIESGLFEIQAKQLLRFGNPREATKPAAEANTSWSNAVDTFRDVSAGSADRSAARGAHYFAAAEAYDLTGSLRA